MPGYEISKTISKACKLYMCALLGYPSKSNIHQNLPQFRKHLRHMNYTIQRTTLLYLKYVASVPIPISSSTFDAKYAFSSDYF